MTETITPEKGLEKRKHPHRKDYTLPEIQRGLVALAYANGNARRAHRDLAAADIHIPYQTLYEWARQTHKDQYESIRAELLPKVGAEVADEHMALARKFNSLAEQLADRLSDEASKLDTRDLPGAMRNASTGAGIHTDKARDLAGDYETPNKRLGNATELLRALKAKGFPVPEVIEGTAEEETEKAD